MTLATTSNTTVAQGNGLTTSFTFTFPVPNASELFVYLTNAGSSPILLSNSQYSTTGIGTENGGSVNYPLVGSPIPTGSTLTIQRIVTYQQLTSLVDQSGYYPNVVENALDYLTMQTQQLAEEQLLALTVPLEATLANLELPTKAGRAGALVGFDALGNAITYPVTASVGAGNLVSEGPFVAGVGFTPGVTTTLTLSKSYMSTANVSVHFDGVYQGPDQYTLSGNQITFTAPIPVGTNTVYIVGGTTLSVGVPAAQSVSPSSIQPTSTFNFGAVTVDGSASTSATPVGNGFAAYGAFAFGYTTIKTNLPEWAFQINVTSSTGNGQGTPNGNKVAFFSGVNQVAGSGDAWAANLVAQSGAGVGANGLVGLEIDYNNSNQNNFAGVAHPYTAGLIFSGAGTYRSQAAIIISGASNMWQRGIYFDNAAGGAVAASSIEDESSSTQSYLLSGTHTYGINAKSAAISGAVMSVPYNCPITFNDSGSTERTGIWFGASGGNNIQIGFSGMGTIIAGGTVIPITDNSPALGSASNRWSVVYAATGTINTSDENHKTDIEPISDTALDAWADVEYCQFKYKDATVRKGTAARLHVGVIAQRIKDAFEKHNLDPFAYAVLCRDDTENGEIYGVRYEEALVMEAALMRRELKNLKEGNSK